MNLKNNCSYKYAEQKYNGARSNLLLMVIFTLINIVIFIVGSDTMFLFSATIPYIATILGTMFVETSLMAIFFAIATVSIVMYFLCWFLSKKHFAWMIVSLILFIIDTLAMIGLYVSIQDFTGIFDVLMHIWILYYLITGVCYGHKLKNMPEDASSTDTLDQNAIEEESDTSALYAAEVHGKARVLLEIETNGHHICYRRLNHTNELVIDGYVYDKFEGILEPSHVLSAKLGGHLYEAGMDSIRSCSFIRVDGEIIKRKIRLW